MPARPTTVAKDIAEQLNRALRTRSQSGAIVAHNLENGLGNERVIRDLLESFLPRQYGIAKGKVISPSGAMSKHLDLIVYDALRCPCLFTDENANQILPIEGVYAVIEIKSTLTATLLEDAFHNLASVEALQDRADRSTNDHVEHCPPLLMVAALRDKRTLPTIAKQYDRLSKKYPVQVSARAYSSLSPGFARRVGRTYLVAEVSVMNRGAVYHMLDGTIGIGDFGDYTLAMFMTGLVDTLNAIALGSSIMTRYLNWIMVDEWRGTGIVAQRQSRLLNSRSGSDDTAAI